MQIVKAGNVKIRDGCSGGLLLEAVDKAVHALEQDGVLVDTLGADLSLKALDALIKRAL